MRLHMKDWIYIADAADASLAVGILRRRKIDYVIERYTEDEYRITYRGRAGMDEMIWGRFSKREMKELYRDKKLLGHI